MTDQLLVLGLPAVEGLVVEDHQAGEIRVVGSEPGLRQPPIAGDEVTTLRAFLDYHRDTLRWKVDGLTQAQQAQRLEPSTMTLGGMMKHLALVESSWFEDAARFPAGAVAFDSALLMRDVAHEWRGHDVLRVARA